MMMVYIQTSTTKYQQQQQLAGENFFTFLSIKHKTKIKLFNEKKGKDIIIVDPVAIVINIVCRRS